MMNGSDRGNYLGTARLHWVAQRSSFALLWPVRLLLWLLVHFVVFSLLRPAHVISLDVWRTS